MTTPAVPVVDSIEGLRKGWPEWVFRAFDSWDSQAGVASTRIEGRKASWNSIARDIFLDASGIEIEDAAQALAAALVAAGWPAEEKA